MADSTVNQLLTITMVTNESLRVLENSLTAARHVNRQYNSSFGVTGAKIGTVLNVRKPPRYLGREGNGLQVEPSIETEVAFSLDKLFGVDIQFSSSDFVLSIDDFSNRFIKPAIANIANRIDAEVTKLYKQINNAVGTPGTTPTELITYLLAGVKLDNQCTPQDEQRGMFLTPYMQAYIVDALKGLFQQSAAIASQYLKGRMGTAAGFDWYMDQNMQTHTVGTYSGTPLVKGASQSGDTLITDGWGNGSFLNEGDIISTTVYSVNPQSRASTGQLIQMVVTAYTEESGGEMDIPVAINGYGMTISGAFQNISASPDDNAPITVFGASGTATSQGMAYHKDCITLASADLELPGGVDKAARASDPQLGISIRLVRAYDINTNNYPCRIEVLFGTGVLRPELGCRVAA